MPVSNDRCTRRAAARVGATSWGAADSSSRRPTSGVVPRTSRTMPGAGLAFGLARSRRRDERLARFAGTMPSERWSAMDGLAFDARCARVLGVIARALASMPKVSCVGGIDRAPIAVHALGPAPTMIPSTGCDLWAADHRWCAGGEDDDRGHDEALGTDWHGASDRADCAGCRRPRSRPRGVDRSGSARSTVPRIGGGGSGGARHGGRCVGERQLLLRRAIRRCGRRRPYRCRRSKGTPCERRGAGRSSTRSMPSGDVVSVVLVSEVVLQGYPR